MKATEQQLEHTAADSQMKARQELARLFRKTPMAEDDLLFNLGMYARSGLLVKFLVMYELYQKFLHIPGIMVEFGCWFGQNLVLLENLRAILEPFNKRRIVAFDTFSGYTESKYAGTGIYSTGRKHVRYLEKLLDCHSRMNVYGHIPHGHELIEGDVVTTAPGYFAGHPEAIVAFAFVDMGPYAPTLAALKAIKPRLVSGSVLLMDELTLQDTPGEAQAFLETFNRSEYTIEKMALYPSKAVVVIK